jgi:argininosuccinate lyase
MPGWGDKVKMWSGRFRQPLDPAFEQWQRSFPFDRVLLPFELEASRAHANALEHAGVLSSEELSEILGGLEQIAVRAEQEPSFIDDQEAEDVHHFVEKQLAHLIGDTGYKLHSGRSRNEQIATDLRLYVRDSLDRIQLLLADFVETLAARAEKSGDFAMPAYTHLQRAEPVLVGHWLLAYADMFLRDSERLADCRTRVNLCPLGSGAVAGATLALDREAMASELGFEAPTANSIDATSDRDFAIEFVQNLTLMGLHLSRWAEEMILFATQEFGFIELPEAYSTGSSAMPQKRNPDLLELVRGKCGRIAGAQQALLMAVKGLPLAYNKDLQETQEPLFEATQCVLAMLPITAAWMGAVDFNYERMKSAAQSGGMNAWAAATYLVERGVPSRLAHEAVGKAVRVCLDRGCELQDLPTDELKQIHPAFDENLKHNLTLQAVISIHDVSGGTAKGSVKQALRRVQENVARIRGQVHAHA